MHVGQFQPFVVCDVVVPFAVDESPLSSAATVLPEVDDAAAVGRSIVCAADDAPALYCVSGLRACVESTNVPLVAEVGTTGVNDGCEVECLILFLLLSLASLLSLTSTVSPCLIPSCPSDANGSDSGIGFGGKPDVSCC